MRVLKATNHQIDEVMGLPNRRVNTTIVISSERGEYHHENPSDGLREKLA